MWWLELVPRAQTVLLRCQRQARSQCLNCAQSGINADDIYLLSWTEIPAAPVGATVFVLTVGLDVIGLDLSLKCLNFEFMLMFSTASFLDFCWSDALLHIVTVSSGCIFTATYSCRADASVVELWENNDKQKYKQIKQDEEVTRCNTGEDDGEKYRELETLESKSFLSDFWNVLWCTADADPRLVHGQIGIQIGTVRRIR